MFALRGGAISSTVERVGKGQPSTLSIIFLIENAMAMVNTITLRAHGWGRGGLPPYTPAPPGMNNDRVINSHVRDIGGIPTQTNLCVSL